MTFTARAAPFGNQAWGYQRTGTGVAGLATAGKGEYGVPQQGVGMASQGTVRAVGADWHPTILYLLGLVIAEMFVFGILGRILR